MKVVINKCYGGFSLSPEATLWLYKNKAPIEVTPTNKYFKYEKDSNSLFSKHTQLAKWKNYLKTKSQKGTLFLTVFSPSFKHVLQANYIKRDNPILVKCVETLKEKANGQFANLKVVEIPDGTEYQIAEYDGMESIEEIHNSWS